MEVLELRGGNGMWVFLKCVKNLIFLRFCEGFGVEG